MRIDPKQGMEFQVYMASRVLEFFTMTNGVRVLVEWTKTKSKHLQSSGKYVTVAKFPEDIDWPQGNTWSMVLVFSPSKIATPQAMKATASFLISEGPWDRLSKANTFELSEGRTHTATGTVVSYYRRKSLPCRVLPLLNTNLNSQPPIRQSKYYGRLDGRPCREYWELKNTHRQKAINQ